jgi:hypothetical protein
MSTAFCGHGGAGEPARAADTLAVLLQLDSRWHFHFAKGRPHRGIPCAGVPAVAEAAKVRMGLLA